MGTRVSYPVEVKQKAVEMRLAGVPMKEILQELNIKNKTQVQTWVRWYKAGDTHRFEQPVGKQYTYGKGPEYSSDFNHPYSNLKVFLFVSSYGVSPTGRGFYVSRVTYFDKMEQGI